MGQQQLLFMVLGIIIVGFAAVYAITLFDVNNTKSNADAMVSEALRIASDIQAWAARPALVGGMQDGETMADVTFADIAYPTSSGIYYSPNAEFTLSTSLGSECSAPIIPSTRPALIYINATNSDIGNDICVAIAGIDAADIGTDTNYGSGITP